MTPTYFENAIGPKKSPREVGSSQTTFQMTTSDSSYI